MFNCISINLKPFNYCPQAKRIIPVRIFMNVHTTLMNSFSFQKQFFSPHFFQFALVAAAVRWNSEAGALSHVCLSVFLRQVSYCLIGRQFSLWQSTDLSPLWQSGWTEVLCLEEASHCSSKLRIIVVELHHAVGGVFQQQAQGETGQG